MHWVYVIPSDGVGQPLDGRERHAGGCRVDRRVVAWSGSDPRSAERPRDLLVRHAARHHDGARVALERPAGASRRPVLGDRWTRWIRPGSAPRSRSTSSTTTVPSRTTTSADRAAGQLGRIRCRGRLLPVLCSACRRLRSRPTSSSTRSAPCRGAAPNDCAGENERPHVRRRERPHVSSRSAASHLRRRFSTPGRNDYYGHAGAWLDTQDSPGSCVSTARRGSR